MKNKRVALLAWCCCIMILAAGCATSTPGRESFETGQGLEKADRLEEAYALYREAAGKEPDNKEYRTALTSTSAILSDKYLESAKTLLDRRPLTFDDAKAAVQQADKALTFTPDGKNASEVAKNAHSQLDTLIKWVDDTNKDAVKAMDTKEWTLAIAKLEDIKRVYPTYLGAAERLRTAQEQAVASYLQEADKFKKNEEWDKVASRLALANKIAPTSKDIAVSLKQAEENNSADYYSKKADEYAAKKDWDTAIRCAQQAQGLSHSLDALHKLADVQQEAASSCLADYKGQIANGKLAGADTSFLQYLKYEPEEKNIKDRGALASELLAAMYHKAEGYATEGKLGNAFVWYEKVTDIDEDYKDASVKFQDIKGRLKERAIKKIAIMDFAPPNGKPDAGKVVTDSLLSYVSAQAGSDVKVLAKDVLGDIIKEIEYGQAGIFDMDSVKKAGRLKGTDVFIMGSVLTYDVDKEVVEGNRSVNVVVAQKSVANPAYVVWTQAMQGRKMTDDERNSAPPMTIQEDVRETVKYKVGTGKKRANVSVSYRIIDVEEGEVIASKTITKSYEVKKDFSEGVEFANIKYEPLELPSDSEVLDKVTQEVAAELGLEVLARFQNLQVQYLDSAELVKRKRDYETALEKNVDAVMIEQIKNMAGPVTEKARKEIEQLLIQQGL